MSTANLAKKYLLSVVAWKFQHVNRLNAMVGSPPDSGPISCGEWLNHKQCTADKRYKHESWFECQSSH